MICSSVYRDRFIRPSPSGPDSSSSWLIFRGACHTIFIFGKPLWYDKPLKQLGLLPRQADIRRVTATGNVGLRPSPLQALGVQIATRI